MRGTALILLAACGGGGGGTPGDDDDDGGPPPVEATECPATQPVVVELANRGFVLDDTHFYFASLTELSRAPIDSPTAVEHVADLPATLAGAFALSDQEVWFAAGGMAFHVAKSGGTPAALGPTTGQLASVATDGTAFYFVAVTATAIELHRVAGGTDTLLAPAPDGASAIAVDAESLFWAGRTGVVQRVPIAGGDPVMIDDSRIEVAANITTFGIATFGGEAIWSATYQSLPDGRLFAKADLRRTLSHTGALTGFAMVGENVYIAIAGTTEGAIAKVPVSGDPRTIIGCVPDKVLSVRANATGVYVTANDTVLRFDP